MSIRTNRFFLIFPSSFSFSHSVRAAVLIVILFHHHHHHHLVCILVTGSDYYVTTSNDSRSDEMTTASTPYQTPWNPVITAPTRPSLSTLNPLPPKHLPMTKSSSSSSPPSACWDWLLYPPEIYSHLYIPSSSFIQAESKDDDLNLLTSLPTWLLALLYPSIKTDCSMDDENESDQEISSLPTHDEALISMHIEKKLPSSASSTLPLLSSDKLPHDQTNRSSTPDTDDGYQSASDASRSDYSQQSSLPFDAHAPLTPKRISYAAAVKPLAPVVNNRINSAPTTPIVKTKNHSSTDINGQKSKFIAPRFERMHHAKQHSSSTTTTTTTTTTTNKKDSSSSSSSLISNNRATPRSNNNNNNNNNHHHLHHNQRNHLINASRRR